MLDLQQNTLVKPKLSASGAIWKKQEASSRDVLHMMQQLSVPEIVAEILCILKIDVSDAANFLSPSIKHNLPNPFLLKDITKCTSRIIKAIQNNEKIAIFGDYDVDGATSSAVLKLYFQKLGCDVHVHIPDRIVEGYGPNEKSMISLKEEHGCSLCITVDCGTVAHDPINRVTELGLDVIVIDHHIGSELLPNAVAVINPNRLDETFPFKDMAAVGVSFLVLVALNSELRKIDFFKHNGIEAPNLLNLLDLVALGTVCDVMPLKGINRAFVTQGLKVINKRHNLGIKSLLELSDVNKVECYHLGFVIGPRINAGGRIGKSSLGTELLSTNNKEKALNISMELNNLNDQRKLLENEATDMLIEKIKKNISNYKEHIIVHGSWHPGIIGIIAGRIKEAFHLPTIVISFFENNSIGKASARSIEGIDVGAAILNAKNQDIVIEGGGHAMAGGFSILKENMDLLSKFLSKEFKSGISEYQFVRKYIKSITVSSINLTLWNYIKKLQPFGVGNPEPRFIINDVYIHQKSVIGEQHVSCRISDNSQRQYIKAIAFRAFSTEIGEMLLTQKRLSLLGKMSCNFWNGKEEMQFIIEDVIKH